MGDTSRKLKNPLLSAAGVSFPFEDFSSNALLMPVTPATSSVLQDEGEVASFVGQPQQPTVSSFAPEFNLSSPVPHPDLQHPHNPPASQHQNAPVTSEIYLSPIIEPSRDNPSESQPQKQGYLSSLLSSLPNLSLSSITGDREDQPPDYNPYPSSYHPQYNPAIGGQPGIGQGNPYGNVANVPLTTTPPVQPAPPPALPPTGVPSSSYRLGNQRRLKYAPPPDLATSNPRINNLPPHLPPQPSFPPAPPAVLFQQQPSGGSGFEPVQSYSLSTQSSPPGTGTGSGVTSPQNIPSRLSSRAVNPEPATPQNTPANQNLLSGFVPAATVTQERDWPPAPKTPQHNAEDDVLREVNLRETPPSAALPTPRSIPEASFPSEKASPASSASPFGPISAARVSEKLEHLLATRKDVVEAEPADSAVDSPVLNFTGGDSFGRSLPDFKDSSGQNLTEKATAARYFSPSLDQPQLPSFYDPAKFQGQINPGAGVSGPQTASGPFATAGLTDQNSSRVPSGIEQQNVPTFYNPTEYAGSVNPNLQPRSYRSSTIGNFVPVAANNPQSYFYSNNANANVNVNQGSSQSNATLAEDPASYFAPPSPPMAAAVPEPTGSATLDPIQMSVNPLGNSGYSNAVDNGLNNVPPSLHNLASGTSSTKQMTYRPVYQHWFHRKEVETKVLWLPFSMQDSLNLEEVHNSSEITPETTVATDGGRYDVDILRRLRTPVYWSGTPNEVRRCSWFYKGPAESRYVPYEENVAARLEEEYQQACKSDSWNRRIELNNGEYIVFHSNTVQVHYLQPGSPELTASWGNNAGSEDSTYLQGATTRPRVVKRGVDEFNIDEGEPDQVDHLLFLVHGIGSVCDLKFRSVEEVVDEFRSISLQLVQSHYRSASEHGTVHKIEVLPISWHTTLHSGDTGIDKKLQAITLESIPKLRHFTNDTLSDILFYTSPIYCQTIMQTVGNEMNRLHALFKMRNPSFQGGVYVGGHSLGSLILFDLLCHQKPPKEEELPEKLDEEEETGSSESVKEDIAGPVKESKPLAVKPRLNRKISYVMGTAGTGQPYINYPQLHFNPSAFFALGSPIGMFVTVRGIDTLGEEFALPTCPAFFNIFHPFDPVAYRVEALIHPDAKKYRPKLIPHHKGRKRMHLELKETMARVGADLKQKLLDSVRSTWNSVYQLAMFHRPDNQALEREIDKVVEEQLQNASNEPESSQQQPDDSGDDIRIGKLNGGRRVDYVLQEAPFEYINEYIFALTSHVCYWESEDTMLMMLKEIYGSMGIQSDAQLPQQTLTIERASPSPVMSRANTNVNADANTNTNTSGSGNSVSPSMNGGQRFDGKSATPAIMGMDPTAPISERPIGPPPTSGFLRKS